MTERPIIFSGPMVRALLAGRKTQTRRVVKGEWQGLPLHEPAYQADALKKCRYGQPGDRLWVRETFTRIPLREADGGQGSRMGFAYRADGEDAFGAMPDEWEFLGKWTPAIHMPRVACRLVLEVTGVRVERLFHISEADCRAEGMLEVPFHDLPGRGWTSDEGQPVSETARRAFEDLWHSINGAWLDCWVWVIEFRRAA